MDIAKSETFNYFTILNKALLFLIKVNKTAVQSIPNNEFDKKILPRLFEVSFWNAMFHSKFT